MLILRIGLYVLAAIGLVSLMLSVMLTRPIVYPPPMASVAEGAGKIDSSSPPQLSRFQARDGTWLAFRLYEPANPTPERGAVLAHGSSAQSMEMQSIARALAASGVLAVSMDTRGHGASGARGDISYPGQLDDDLADLMAHLDKRNAHLRWFLIGHSSGGGFVLRIAASPLGGRFEKHILLAPYLGHDAPTTRPTGPGNTWAVPNVPRIIAIQLLSASGFDGLQSLPVLAFAIPKNYAADLTSSYSYRLMTSYAAPRDWAGAFKAASKPIVVIAGEADELIDAQALRRELGPLGARVTLLAQVDHMGVVHEPAAMESIVRAVNE